MKKINRLGLITIILSFIGLFLLPYTSLRPSLITTICHTIFFFLLPGISYYLGVYTKNNNIKYKNIILSILLINIIAILTKQTDIYNLYSITPILIAALIWIPLSNKLNNIIYILLSFIISITFGFLKIDNSITYIITLLPFFLLGHNLNIKFNKNYYKYIGIPLLIITIIGTVFILNKFYVSIDILLLKSFVSKKHLIFRLGYFLISIIYLLSLRLIFNDEKDNSYNLTLLSILPIIQILFNLTISNHYYNNSYIIYALITIILISIITKLIFNKIDKILDTINYKNIANIISLLLLIGIILIQNIKVTIIDYPIYNKMTNEERNAIDNALSISFVGDLILLENQVKAAYTENGYDFNPMFEYTKDYLSSSDLSIGVLEGPVSPSNRPTIGNFDDGAPLYLNFPIEFIDAIKNNGIDLVTISNNHILDQGIDGYKETINSLKDKNLDYIGTTEKRYKIITKDNIKIGILAYTYGTNYYEEDELIELNITPVIVPPSSKNFKKIKKQVIEDFNNLKKENVDIIIVLPHMGTQFSHETDVMQNTWNKIFSENGATIVFGDHSHAVEPIEEYNNIVFGNHSTEYYDGTIIINSPGNFANQYTDHDGDATAITEVYIDKTTKKVIASSIVPMYTYGKSNGFYQALPIYTIMHNKELYDSLSTNDLKRINEVHSIITKTMLNTELKLDNIEYKYYLFKDGYKRNTIEPLDISEYQDNELISLIRNSTSVCFIGDSITEGTMNGGYGWYEPITANYNIPIRTAAYGSYTTKMILKDKTNDIKKCSADLNIIAIGTNDIRYQDQTKCASNKEEYIKYIEEIIQLLNSDNIVLIAPFISTDSDTKTPLSPEEKKEEFKNYSDYLKEYANKNNYLYINPNKIITNTLLTKENNYYMVDYIHPNKTNGIYMYSKAILDSIKKEEN